MIVNAICHRDYSILGTDIQVKIFDNHITVESPGIFPGLVRPNNIREIHFSRNPKIAAILRANKLVKEFGEGVDRMYRELEEGGFPEPSFTQVAFMIKASIWERKVTEVAQSRPKDVIDNVIESSTSLSQKTGVTQRTIMRDLDKLRKKGLIRHVGADKGGYWEVLKKS